MSAEATAGLCRGVPARGRAAARGPAQRRRGGRRPPVSPATGAALRFIAAAVSARSVVEIGTGCGTSGIWLLRGMRPDGRAHQRGRRARASAAGAQGVHRRRLHRNRFRLIGGKASDVLPRLTDGGYDLVFCDADKQEYPDYLAAALRLLRPGGVVAFDNALWGGKIADPSRTDPETTAHQGSSRTGAAGRAAGAAAAAGGDGLLVAVKRGQGACPGRPGASQAQQQPGAEPGGALGPLPIVGRRPGRARRCPGGPRAARR